MNNDYIIEIAISGPEHPAFALDFYVERERSQRFTYEMLERVSTPKGVRYYALLDAERIGRGNLMCKISIPRSIPLWKDREQSFTVYTGITIGACVCNSPVTMQCGEFTFTFASADAVPLDTDAHIFYGKVNNIASYDKITDAVVKQLTEMPVQSMDIDIQVKAGDRLVVLIPENSNLVASKVSAFSTQRIPFDSSVMGANGEIYYTYNTVTYKVYGQFVTVDSGTLNIRIS